MKCDDIDSGSDDSSSDTEQETIALAVPEKADQPDETPFLSINAINGSTSYKCMCLVGHFGHLQLP